METIGGDAVTIIQAEREAQVKTAAAQGTSWSLAAWEEYLNAINPNYMELGLKRINAVAQRLQLHAKLQAHGCKIVTVAGTNGKGSTCALIANCMKNLGYQVGLYTSPHLLHFNERIQINSQNIADEPLCRCLHQVIQAQVAQVAQVAMVGGQVAMAGAQKEKAEGQEPSAEQGYIDLSYFEIITLAAMLAFIEAGCEVLVLEVGLGGRLDAVNLFKHDVSIITSIGLDHMKILGDTVEKIAFEKAGIIHSQDYTIIGSNIPKSALAVIQKVAAEQQATLYQEQLSFKVSEQHGAGTSASVSNTSARTNQDHIVFSSDLLKQWPQEAAGQQLTLAWPKVPFICAGPALQAVLFLMQQKHCPLSTANLEAINQALASVALPGRMQQVQVKPAVYLDVAHNVPAAQHLKVELKQHLGGYQRRLVVMGMLKDKDVEGVIAELKDSFDAFYVASLHVPRGESKERLVEALERWQLSCPIVACDTVAEALGQAQAAAGEQDVIVVMGSFVTVAEAQQALAQSQ